MEPNRNFRYSKTNKSEQFSNANSAFLSKNPQSSSSSDNLGRRQSSMKNPGLHQRRFLIHMEKLRSIHEKKKICEKRRKSVMPMLGFRERNNDIGGGQKSKINTLSIPLLNQPTLQRKSTKKVRHEIEQQPVCVVNSPKHANEQLENSSALFIQINDERSDQSLLQSQKRMEAQGGVKYEYNLDLKNPTDSELEDEESIPGFHSQNTTFVHNVKQTYFYESHKDIKKFATRLREFKNYNTKLILPDDPWKVKWNFFLLMIILISSVITPLRATFYDEDELLWQLIDGFIDLVFVLDICFTFFSAYYNNIEELISNRREICCNYLQSWFILDLISVLPFSYIFNSSANQLGKLAKLPRIFQIIKTTKFV